MANKTAESSLNSTVLNKPTIVLVPFFGGKRVHLKKHIEFLEQLGYPTYFVELNFEMLPFVLKPFSAINNGFGMKRLWADHIEKCLNQIPGKKIIFSFSNPSAGAIEAISRRNGHDIVGLICDGGPTGELFKSILNYYEHEKPMPFLPLKYLASFISTHLMTLNPKEFCFADLKKFPPFIPILSIRGWKDPLISPKQIDMIFEPHHQLNWSKLSLPQGGHLDGLKNFRNEYVKGVQDFLNSLTF
jgi:hypothetical protein